MARNNKIAAITVTYHPDLQLLNQQIAELRDYMWIIFDNNSNYDELAKIEDMIESRPFTYLIKNSENVGLAAAINMAIDFISHQNVDIDFILLLDQDSIPLGNSIELLKKAFCKLEKEGMPVGCVGPQLVDIQTGLQYGFHIINRGMWKRYFPENLNLTPLECSSINGSGTFMRLDLFKKIGGLKGDFFIDHIDTEWSFRVINCGYKLFGVPEAVFEHRMGERSLSFWLLGWKFLPYRSPLRHYYLFRNNISMLWYGYVPVTWKFWSIIKLIFTILVYIVFDRNRKQQLMSMFKGIKDGM
ncbi:MULTISPECIES: rhamnosyltransferase [Acinetobacter]|uniref:Rhamnosyltransferase n=1 Tax=Acinetobacter corruptisaponis TaxID=3045147 RepID=A0ABY8S0N9_9GAMM|nr:rhamnosyltransferase [Acinetobacter sp. KCTC 92772]WHP04861.1 rhamnosyltransferase [Acinetobacter sp. KCTC 92772]